MRYLAEPGDFEVFVGGSSAVVNHARFTLKKPDGKPAGT
jgi:hypothetical protein